MKELTTYFTNKNILFKEIKSISPKDLNSRKKIEIYASTTIDSKFYAIFIVTHRQEAKTQRRERESVSGTAQRN